MPIIDLSGPRSLSRAGIRATERLWALMAYPNDPEARQQLFAVTHADELGKIEQLRNGDADSSRSESLLPWMEEREAAGLKAAGGIGRVARVPGIDEVESRWRKRSVSGRLAGEVLLFQLRPPYAVGGRDGPSVRQAVHALAQHFEDVGGRTSDGSKIPTSRPTIMRAWQEFRSVAPLWAACCHLELPNERQGSLAQFLATAEAIRQRAEAAKILKPDETWRAPEGIDLPTVDFKLDPISDRIRCFLRSYRHPPR